MSRIPLDPHGVELYEAERLRWLEEIARHYGYDPDARVACLKTGFQNCGQCPRLECCDNTSPVKEDRTRSHQQCDTCKYRDLLFTESRCASCNRFQVRWNRWVRRKDA